MYVKTKKMKNWGNHQLQGEKLRQKEGNNNNKLDSSENNTYVVIA